MWICINMQKLRLFHWAFWPIFQGQGFSQISGLYRYIANNTNHLKNPSFDLFLRHFPNFGGKKCFSKISSSVTHNFISVSSTMPNLKKLIIKFHGNTWADRRTEGWTEPILKDPSGYRWGSNKYSCCSLEFKSQR